MSTTKSPPGEDFRLHSDFVQVPRYVFDSLLPIRYLSNSMLRVLLFIFRKTIGWGKQSDYISLSQIEFGARVSRRDAKKALDFWERLRVIRVLPRGKRMMNEITILDPPPDPEKIENAILDWGSQQKAVRELAEYDRAWEDYHPKWTYGGDPID